MFVDFIRNHYRNQLGNACKKQAGVQCFFVLCFASCQAKTILEVVNGFFYIPPDFISRIPFGCPPDGSRISTEVLLRVNVDHSSARRGCARMVTVTDTMGFFCNFIPFPFHFRTDKFHGWKPTAQMGFTAFLFHGKGRVFRATGDTLRINGIIDLLNFKLVF